MYSEYSMIYGRTVKSIYPAHIPNLWFLMFLCDPLTSSIWFHAIHRGHHWSSYWSEQMAAVTGRATRGSNVDCFAHYGLSRGVGRPWLPLTWTHFFLSMSAWCPWREGVSSICLERERKSKSSFRFHNMLPRILCATYWLHIVRGDLGRSRLCTW